MNKHLVIGLLIICFGSSMSIAAVRKQTGPKPYIEIVTQEVIVEELGPRFVYRSEIGLAADSLGYQEHVTDYPRNNATGKVDSSASPTFLALRGRWEMLMGKGFFGLRSVLPMVKTVVKETWNFNEALMQTNDLSYTLTSVDFYGGYFISRMLEPLGGIRVAKGEQVRENFYDQNNVRQNVGKSTETITSVNLFADLRGQSEGRPLSFGYSVEGLLPVSVSTVNDLLPGFNFSSAGYTLAVSGNICYAFSPANLIKGEIGYTLVHYNGTDWQTSGVQRAKWPQNDTQDLSAVLGWVYSY